MSNETRPPGSATDKQVAFLKRNGINFTTPIDRLDASDLIRDHIQGRRELAATARQCGFLKHHGQWREGLTRGEAFDRISGIRGTQGVDGA
jgi:hypothetical protein